MTNRLITIIIAGTLWSTVANGHHTASSHYLMDQSITVEGVVTDFRLINPHVRLYFNVTTENGEVEQWLGEGQAAGIQRRLGWTEDMLKPGDAIKITGHPARDGGNKLDWQFIELSDGTLLRGGTTAAEDRTRRLEELDKQRRAQ